MRTADAQQTGPSLAIAKHNQIFAKHPNCNGNVTEARGQTYRVPIAPEHRTAPSPRPGARQLIEQFLIGALSCALCFGFCHFVLPPSACSQVTNSQENLQREPVDCQPLTL